MYMKLIFLLSLLSVLEAQLTVNRPCVIPRLANGRVRSRQRTKLIKFICQSGYELVGNRYSTCKNGRWDTPKPICVKPGCTVPRIKNGLANPSFNDSWVVFFCMPEFRMVGSSSIYCDGSRWNDSAPTCVGSKAPTLLSCDFESPDICGWSQDALHDFDWERINKKTPSSFLFTGPSYDHTYGLGQSGYYMYIESSSRLENNTARLLSPIFEPAVIPDGCFSFYYHMFGRHTGGLRVYQKPESIELEAILSLPDEERERYQLFEQWGNQGDFWFGEVAPLKDMREHFQIVIEGIRGKKFTSDIAIDDVAILQGEECHKARREASTPAVFLPDSCDGRCTNSTKPVAGCSCNLMCFIEENCCSDFFEICVYSSDTGTDDTNPNNTTIEPPQTQKLVAKSTTPIVLSTRTTYAVTQTTTSTIKPTTFRALTTTVRPPTSTPKPTTPTTIAKITGVTTTTQKVKVTIFQKDEINGTYKDDPQPKTTNATMATTGRPTPELRTAKPVVFTKVFNRKTTVVFKPATKAIIKKLTTPPIQTTKPLRPTGTFFDKNKLKEDEQGRKKNQKSSSAWRAVLITGAVLACLAGLVWLFVVARGERGRAALAYMRGSVRNDPEVRYLHASDPEDD